MKLLTDRHSTETETEPRNSWAWLSRSSRRLSNPLLARGESLLQQPWVLCCWWMGGLAHWAGAHGKVLGLGRYLWCCDGRGTLTSPHSFHPSGNTRAVDYEGPSRRRRQTSIEPVLCRSFVPGGPASSNPGASVVIVPVPAIVKEF